MSQNPNSEIDEIDFREVLAAIWAHKILICLITSLFSIYSGFHSLTLEKKFTAEAIFQIKQKNSGSGFNLSGDLASIASIARIADGNNVGSEALLERLSGREFVLRVIQNLSLHKDPFFNTYNPNYKDPLWKATIKKLVGWQKTILDRDLLVENSLVNNYRASVNFGLTEGGAFKLAVTHSDPQKASEYANNSMEEIRLIVQQENNLAQDMRLAYLSETLADALQDMEEAQKNLKQYALENSTMAKANFISGSLKLNEVRYEKVKVVEIYKLLFILDGLIRSGNLDSNSYEILRSSHPLVDDIDFRRILGMSETISAWTWPELETIETVIATLRDRIKRLEVDIKNIKENAKVYAASADDQAKLTREVKIAEATYTVLTEQVKSHSLAAGFQPDTFKVFEYATPPISASSPNRKIVLVLGTALGILFSCALALIKPMLLGIYYTRSALLSDINTGLVLSSKKIRRLSRRSIPKMISLISKQNFPVLNEAEVKLSNSKVIYVFNYGGQPSASDTARLLAIKSAQSGKSVIICDTTGESALELKNKPIDKTSGHAIASLNNNINVITDAKGASFFTSNKFTTTIENLSKDFDQIFICTTKSNATLGLMALEKFEPSLVLIAGLRSSRKLDIRSIKDKQSVDLLFYG